MIRNVFLWGVMLAAVFGFVACSSDDEPAEPGNESEYNYVLRCIVNAQYEIVYPQAENNPSIRCVAVEDEADAIDFVCWILNEDEDWNGTRLTKNYGGDYGYIIVDRGFEDGLFATIVVNIKDVEPFTLYLATAEYFENENFAHSSSGAGQFDNYWYYKCDNCGYHHNVNASPPSECPSCHVGGRWTKVTVFTGIL